MAPQLELLVAPAPDPRVEALIGQLRRWCVPRAIDGAAGQPAARLATAPDALGVTSAALDPHVPLAVWTSSELAAVPPGAVAVGPRSVVGDAGGVAVPDDWIDGSRWPFASPLVRRRRRQHHRLPEELVVEVGAPDGPALPDDLVVVALAVCAATRAVGRQALAALALGAPVVTDPSTAAWLGADDGEHVLIEGSREAALASAATLARDDHAAAALARAGRELVAERFDLAASARALAAALGLDRVPDPVLRARHRLAELACPPGAEPARRVAARLGELGPSTLREVQSWVW